tara:strand:- start:930 stop:1289 length:360 start_codon:yes stop_codon:yes gene_type:complete
LSEKKVDRDVATGQFAPGNKAAAGSRRGGRRPKEVSEALDNYTVEGLSLLWTIATDEDHEWHKRFGFDALKAIVNHATPKRKEVTGSEGGPIDLSLPGLFHGNSLPELEDSEDEDDGSV